MPSPESWAESIRSRVRSHPRGRATIADLESIELSLAVHPDSVELWILRGDLIQLDESGSVHYTLEDALQSYVHARSLDPTYAEAHQEIGHNTDSIEDDSAGAIPHHRRAIALGGGDSAIQALTDAILKLNKDPNPDTDKQ